MWPFTRKPLTPQKAQIFFTNTLGATKQPFIPLKPGVVTLYSCGPTVYSRQHIGNMRAAVFADILARVLKQNSYHVRRVINITDVGHLTGDNEGDADQGEDRMEKSARESGQRANDIAAHFTKLYLDDIRTLGIDTDEVQFPYATNYIPEQISLVQALEKSGHTYRTQDGIYFDVSTFPGYGKLGSIPQETIKSGDAEGVEERIALVAHGRIKENKDKRNPQDFALWKFSSPSQVRQQEWSSPWGRGFPGWHAECSAMIKALLGETIDIHTGGIEHIPVHHNNEIAQSESISNKPLARYWLHQAHLTLGTEKISKSKGSALYISDIEARGFHPLALRYFFLQANYHSSLSFSWEAIGASSEALKRLWKISSAMKQSSKDVPVFGEESEKIRTLLADDLGTPRALALLWETVRDDEISAKRIWGAIVTADEVFGLSLINPPTLSGDIPIQVPAEVQELVQERENARADRDFDRADELRIHIENRGYTVEDAVGGAKIHSK